MPKRAPQGGQGGCVLQQEPPRQPACITASYFEWVQDKARVFWKREQVEAMLREQLLEAYGRVRDRAERSGADFRTAAQAVALERIAQAAALRGVYP